MNRTQSFAASLIVSLVFVALPSYSNFSIQWDFENETIGDFPSGWKRAENNGIGKPAHWEIIKHSDGSENRQALALTQTENPNPTFNLAIAQEAKYKNVRVSVKLKALSGQLDQGGGLIWRVQSPNDYYIARWNPLENNFRVYYVKKSERKQIANADVELDSKQWHEITITMVGSKITASLNGKQLIEVEDLTFTESGHIGLWTKADAATAFDDLRVEEIK